MFLFTGICAYDFMDVCFDYMGKPGRFIALLFSIITLLGAAMVYWVLMANFFYNIVTFAYGECLYVVQSFLTVFVLRSGEKSLRNSS